MSGSLISPPRCCSNYSIVELVTNHSYKTQPMVTEVLAPSPAPYGEEGETPATLVGRGLGMGLGSRWEPGKVREYCSTGHSASGGLRNPVKKRMKWKSATACTLLNELTEPPLGGGVEARV